MGNASVVGNSVLRGVLILMWAVLFGAGPALAEAPASKQNAAVANHTAGPAPEPSGKASQVRSGLSAQKGHAVAPLGRVPLSFEENRGQVDAEVKFLSRGNGYTLALTEDEAVLALRTNQPAVLRMGLAGARDTARISGEEPLPGKIYYVDGKTKGPLTGSRTFHRVRSAGVYPGIDAVYHSENDRLEFDFVVSPHADPNVIRLAFTGADQIALAETGALVLQVAGEEVQLLKPVIYQEIAGARHEVAGGFVLHKDSSASFAVGDYDPSLPLVIDPVWTFGSTSEDLLVAIETNSAGQPYVLGMSFDPATLPSTVVRPGILPPPNCFLTKLDAATGLLSYLIVFQNAVNCDTLAVSPSNIVYFTGFSLPNNRATTVTAVDDSSGVPVINSFAVTNYDSSGVGRGVRSLAVNSLEHLFLLGECRMVGPGEPPLLLNGFNTTPNPANGAFADACTAPVPQGTSAVSQMVLSVVDNTGSFLYGSLLSPGELANPGALTANDADQAFVVGSSSSTLAVTPDAYRPTCPEPASPTASCSYLMMFDTFVTGPASLRYASYLWNHEDFGERMAVRQGPAGEVFIATSGRVFVTGADGLTLDFPNNRPTPPYPCNAPCFPNVTEGVQLARFDADLSGAPNLLHFALLEGPLQFSGGLLGREELMDLRLLPSGAPVLTSVGFTATETRGIYRVFYPSGELRALLGDFLLDLAPAAPKLLQAVDPNGTVFLAHHLLRPQSSDSDIRVADLSFFTGQPFTDPGANTPPPATSSRAYITNAASDTVSVIDTTSNTVVATVPVGDGPYGVAVNPAGTRAYVTNANSNNVSVLDTATNTVIATVPVGFSPYGVALNPYGTRAYVTNGGSNSVSVIDTASNTVVATVPVGNGPLGVAVDPGGTRVYVANNNSGTLSVINTTSNTVIATVSVGSFATGVAVNPAGTRVYVTSDVTSTFSGSGRVSVIETGPYTVIATVTTTGRLPAGVAINRDGTRVYVADSGSGFGSFYGVSVLDTASNTVIATVPVGRQPYGVAVNPTGTRVYVANNLDNNVSVIDTATNTVIDTVAVGTWPLAFGLFIGGVAGSPPPDTLAPVVTAPADISVPATEAGGARGSASTLLASFLAGGSAVDAVDPAPTRLAPQVSGIDADNNTLFPIGTNIVTFRFRDAAGNIGTATANVTVAPPPPNLAASKTPLSSLTVNNGDTVPFRLVATNNGSGATTGPIAFVDTLPAGLTFVQAGSDPRCSAVAQVVTCIVAGPIQPNDFVFLDIATQVGANVAAPNQSVDLNNVLAVSTPNDSDPSDDVAGAFVTVQGPPPPDLVLNKSFVVASSTTSQLTVHNGDAVRYRLRVMNIGNGPTQGTITVTDTLDSRLTFTATGSDPLCSAAAQVVTCSWAGPLGVSQSRDFDIAAVVGSGAAPLGQSVQINNIASVSTPNDSDSGNDVSFPLVLTVDNPDVTPPVVTPPQSIVVAAILSYGTHGNEPNLPDSVAVANFVSGGSATDDLDPNPVRLSLVLVDCNNPSVITSSHSVSIGTVFPVGTTCVRFSYQDAAGNVGMATASITVNPPIGGVVSTEGVPVTATDASNIPQPVTLTFYGPLGGGGLVQANPIVPPPAVPAGFRIAGVAYNITTTVPSAEVTSIRICFTGGFLPGDVIYHNGTAVTTTVSGGAACAFVSSLSPFMVLRPNTAPALQLPANIVAEATSVAGAHVTFTVTASDAEDGSLTPTCAPASGSVFPLGVATVNCTATDSAGASSSGSFTVTVQVGAPRIAGAIAGKGRDASGNFYVDLRLSNTGTGHARGVQINSLAFRTLSGTGTVSYNAALSGALPLTIGAIDAGSSATVRLFLNVPATVTRFSITESGTLQNVLGVQSNLSFGQSVIP